MADIIPFPCATGGKPRPAATVTIHCHEDGSAIVVVSPCPPGVVPRRAFSTYDDAWPYADRMAAEYGRTEGLHGSSSHRVAVLGPEEEADND